MRKLLPLLFLNSLYGHDLYLMPQKFHVVKGESILLSTHTGDSFPVSEQPADPARLSAWPQVDPTAWRMMNKATHAVVAVTAEGGLFYSVSTKARYLEMEPALFNDYLTKEGMLPQLALRKQLGEGGATSREMYAKFAKTYVVSGKPDGKFATPIGMKIEIVPLAEPSAVKPGESLPILVLYDGKPFENAQVEVAISEGMQTKADIKVAGKTDKNGKLNVPIASRGRVRLHALRMERVKQPTHDWESFWASLTFEVAPQSITLTSR